MDSDRGKYRDVFYYTYKWFLNADVHSSLAFQGAGAVISKAHLPISVSGCCFFSTNNYF